MQKEDAEGGSFFRGRTVAVVNDLSPDERLYLYEKTRELKRCLRQGEDPSPFKLRDRNFGVYLIFLEDSTRTKESFRNAALFHEIKLNDFDAKASSLNKQEGLADTVKMLTGYSQRSLFIIRSSEEGTCRMLQDVMGEYAEKMGCEPPSFLNGGDGRHEHPTQEFLDEYTLLERGGWQKEHLHIALVGDLRHGRTVHSKVDGLTIFSEVEVDLVAPEELALPVAYEKRMERNGFCVRRFETIERYLEEKRIAPHWYFTRLQLERMGDEIREKVDTFRGAVTFSEELLSRIPEGITFYHPLPRHKERPVIPHFLDGTPLNGWDEQAMNGYYTRILTIALLGGALGEDFPGGKDGSEIPLGKDYVKEVPPHRRRSRQKCDPAKTGIKPVEEGIVIDHIGMGRSIETIWRLVDRIRRIMRLNCRGSQGVFLSHQRGKGSHKGLISLPGVPLFDAPRLKMLSAIAPGCTLNIVQDGAVDKKFRLTMPPRIYNFDEISCRNQACISHPSRHEGVGGHFLRASETTFTCRYCERPHDYGAIWNDTDISL